MTTPAEYASNLGDAAWTKESADALAAYCKSMEDQLHKTIDGKFVLLVPESMPDETREYLVQKGFEIHVQPRMPCA